ncbi:MAG: hypothetical protein K1X57_17970 [Gemmataceae bacterium]|nr:hypothetical protein [Gemmataceae bacterium]
MAVLALVTVVLTADDRPKRHSEKVDDELLRNEPLTIVFRQLGGLPQPGKPSKREWSINSAGDGELTINHFPNVERQAIKIPADKLASFRQVLRDEKFLQLQDGYGRHFIDGGWCTLTVIAGEHINKTIRFYDVWGWTKGWEPGKLAEAAPAGRVWLRIAEIVDPDAKVLTEQKDLATAIKALTK